MQCRYCYRATDKAVVLGKKKVGDRCGSNFAKPELDGYCYAHAKQLGLIPTSEIRKANRKISRSKLQGNDPKKLTKVNKFLKSMADLIKADGLNAEEALRDVYALNPYPDIDSGAEKYVFVLWSIASPKDRKPSSLSAFAELVKVPVSTLKKWRRSKDFANMFSVERTRRMLTYGPIVDMALVAQCVAGDTKAMNTFYSLFPVHKKAVEMTDGKTEKGISTVALKPDVEKRFTELLRAKGAGAAN